MTFGREQRARRKLQASWTLVFFPSRHASALRVGGGHAPCWPVAEHDRPAGLETICARERMPSPVQSKRQNHDGPLPGRYGRALHLALPLPLVSEKAAHSVRAVHAPIQRAYRGSSVGGPCAAKPCSCSARGGSWKFDLRWRGEQLLQLCFRQILNTPKASAQLVHPTAAEARLFSRSETLAWVAIRRPQHLSCRRVCRCSDMMGSASDWLEHGWILPCCRDDVHRCHAEAAGLPTAWKLRSRLPFFLACRSVQRSMDASPTTMVNASSGDKAKA